MRNKSKLIGGVMLALFVVFAISMPVTAAVRERIMPIPPANETYLLFSAHYLDNNNNFVGGWSSNIMPAVEGGLLYESLVPNDAVILEGYFERWCNVSETNYGAYFAISYWKTYNHKAGPEWLYEPKYIKCRDLNGIYPFSIDVSKYRGKKLGLVLSLLDDICPTDTKQLALDLIDATESRISELKREGVETAEIEELVKRAKEKYDAGDHVEAAKIATDAKSRADLAYHNKKSFRVECNHWPPLLPLATTPTPSPTPSSKPTSSPTPTPTPTPSPIEQTPTPLPPTPPPDDGNNSWIFLIIAVLAGIVVLFSFKLIMIAYYTRKINKWEREGYDVSKLKEVLKR